jgi:hypothetical protein
LFGLFYLFYQPFLLHVLKIPPAYYPSKKLYLTTWGSCLRTNFIYICAFFLPSGLLKPENGLREVIMKVVFWDVAPHALVEI